MVVTGSYLRGMSLALTTALNSYSSLFLFSVSYPLKLKMVYALLERVMHIKSTMKRSVTLDDFAQDINMHV